MVKTIEALNLVLRYGSQTILDDVGFSLHQGRITAMIGPNGAGKSSAFRILAGLVKPDEGEVWVDLRKLKSIEDLRTICCYLLESPDFYTYLSGKKNLELLIRLSGTVEDAEKLLDMVWLSEEKDKKVRNYSRGMKQRLGIAQVMIGDPSFFILDEPFNGLDPDVKEKMLDLLVILRNQGKGILVSTHQLEDIETIADDFIFLNKGKLFLAGTMNNYRENMQTIPARETRFGFLHQKYMEMMR